jgi:hypothetical protein
MATVTRTLAHFDFQYGDADWRRDLEETFQLWQRIATDYTVVDGQVVREVETTWEFASAIAYVAINPITGPPYFYADGNYYADPAFIFQKTHIKTKTYSSISDNSYDITIDDYDVLLNKHTITHVQIDGKIPLAVTVNSALSNLVQQPLVGSLSDECGFVDSKQPIDLPWAESEADVAKATKRAMQRATAVVRRVKCKANPFIKITDTVLLIDDKRQLNAPHLVVAKTTTLNPETGEATDTIDLEDWTR